MRLRFLFSAADQGRVQAASVAVADVAYAAAPQAGQPYPQAAQITFQVVDPASLPQIRPLFPGELRFIPDPTAPGVTPEPDAVQFTDAAYATWRTRGALRVTLDLDAGRELPPLASNLEVVPNVVWYSPIRITRDFLFNTLRNGLQRRRIGGTPAIQPANPAWERHAVARFLSGGYRPMLRLGADAASDDVVAHAMPTVEPTNAQGNVSLVVTTATRQDPQDGPRRSFDDLSAGVDEDDPVHARNGVLPARHVYRSLRPHLIDADPGSAVPDRVLAEGGATPRYHAIRFTRTWQPIANCSAHFPRQQVVVSDHTGAQLARQRLAAHGIFYWSSPANVPVGTINIAIAGTLRWIDAATPAVWRHPAGTAAIGVDLAAVPSPHIQLRLPMAEAMLVEPRDRPGGLRCTYLSLRRSLRALVDNRIAGGRLSFGRASTSAPTRAVIDAAWAGTGAQRVANNRPLPNADPNVGNQRLIPVFTAFFPDNVPPETIDGSTNRTDVYRGGEMAYRLWQTIVEEFQTEGTKRNFPNAHVGRGGPGALVATGLAAAYRVDPVRNAGEADAAYFDRVVGDVLAGLQPGAVLQFWNESDDFDDIKARSVPGAPPALNSYGHSPVFLRYLVVGGNVTGIRVIDQEGERDCPVHGAAGNRRIRWAGDAQEIWIAANWSE